MSGEPVNPEVQSIIDRFFAERSAGRRVSIDEVMDSVPGVADRAATRISALETIALRTQELRQRAASADSEPAEDDSLRLDDVRIPGYEVIDRAGAGGMGVVYEAYQKSTGRRVAIKFMRAAMMASSSARQRFLREVELVARLEHPNIVSVLDSGTHKGLPYYVMEYVSGRPLDAAMPPGWAGLDDSLRLVQVVCRAIDYAHQRGVLHRDLKPSNILIDERGAPRIVDFGLAKGFEPGADEKRAITLSEPGEIMGTLAYMPPEQAEGRFDQMSVRSDVYSLGAIAYLLITGRVPSEMAASLHQTLHEIIHVDPTRPSALRKGVSGDVDAILMKALEKDPQRRYATAEEFAGDIERYLQDRPIIARRMGPAGRALRWARRNRAVSTVGVLAVAVIAAISAASIYRVTMERDIAKEMSLYLDDTLASLTPDGGAGSVNVNLREYYANREAWLAAHPPRWPQVAAVMHARLGLGYRTISDFERAATHLSESLRIRRGLWRGNHADVAQNLHDLAAVRYDLGDLPTALGLYREALAMRLALFGKRHPDVVTTRSHIAAVLTNLGDHATAEEMYREILSVRREEYGDRHENVAASINNLATCLREQGRFAEAAPLFAEALDMLIEVGGEEHVFVASARHNVATCLIELGRHEEAERLLQLSVSAKRAKYGDDSVSLARSLHQLARLRLRLGDPAGAKAYSTEALRIQEKQLPAGHTDAAASRALLSEIQAAEH